MKCPSYGALLGSLGAALLAALVAAVAQERPFVSQTDGRSYPAPRFPSYLSTPKNVEEIMPVARRLVRATVGLQGGGLGVANAGETVAVISTVNSDPMFIEAIRR